MLSPTRFSSWSDSSRVTCTPSKLRFSNPSQPWSSRQPGRRQSAAAAEDNDYDDFLQHWHQCGHHGLGYYTGSVEFLRKSREARLPEDSLTLVESLNSNNIKVSKVISTVMMISGHLRMAAQSDLLVAPAKSLFSSSYSWAIMCSA